MYICKISPTRTCTLWKLVFLAEIAQNGESLSLILVHHTWNYNVAFSNKQKENIQEKHCKFKSKFKL